MNDIMFCNTWCCWHWFESWPSRLVGIVFDLSTLDIIGRIIHLNPSGCIKSQIKLKFKVSQIMLVGKVIHFTTATSTHKHPRLRLSLRNSCTWKHNEWLIVTLSQEKSKNLGLLEIWSFDLSDLCNLVFSGFPFGRWPSSSVWPPGGGH